MIRTDRMRGNYARHGCTVPVRWTGGDFSRTVTRRRTDHAQCPPRPSALARCRPRPGLQPVRHARDRAVGNPGAELARTLGDLARAQRYAPRRPQALAPDAVRHPGPPVAAGPAGAAADVNAGRRVGGAADLRGDGVR